MDPQILSDERIAEIAHEANRVYCLSIGDNSQPHWDNAADWAKESAIKGVIGIKECRIKKPSDSHESWMAEKLAEGWTYGPIKDPATKQHPCMVSYEQLSEEQRRKDDIFFNTVSTLLFVRSTWEKVAAGVTPYNFSYSPSPVMATADKPQPSDQKSEESQ